MVCESYTKYTGNRSQVIRSMINDKLKKEFIKNEFPKLAEDRKLIQLYCNLRDKAIELSIVRKELNDYASFKNIQVDTYDIEKKEKLKFDISYKVCFTPKKILLKLEEADRLLSLGKNKQASVIFEKIIKDYNLTKVN